MKVTCANGDDLDLADPVGPVNNWLHSLFSQVDVYLNGTPVTPSTNTYARHGYTFFGFNLTPDQWDGPCFHLVQRGNLRIELHFRDALTTTVNVIAYAEFESVLEIDKSRNVIYDYWYRHPADRQTTGDGPAHQINISQCRTQRRTAYEDTAFVCNTDDGDEPGEHWIALYLDADGRGYYFCSYGLPPRHAAFRTFMNEHCSEWTHNSKRLRSPLSNVCGQYCIAYVLLFCNGFPMRTFINIFGTDLVANDSRVFDWLKQLRQDRLYCRTSYIDWASGEVDAPLSSWPLAWW